MKNTFAKMFTVCALAGVLGFALSACDDSSSAGDDDNNVILSGDSREESGDSRSNDKDEAISSSGKVTDKDSDAKSSDPAEVTDDSSDSKDNPSSAGTSTKSSNSNTSGNDAKSSSSAGEVNCSALLEGKTGWSWDVPKECRFNPDIDYGTMTDNRDNKRYKTVKIGDQVWMAENLNYSDSTKTPSLLKRNWCYNDNVANCEVAGRLYTWAAAMDSVALYDGGNGVDCGYGKTCMPPARQGICPNGWHLPTQTEWFTLLTAVGGQSTASKVLKSQSGWYSGGNGTDAYGFSVLPAGYRSYGGYSAFSSYFNFEGYNAFFWSSSEGSINRACYMTLHYYNDHADVDYSNKDLGYSVRCLKDSE